MRDAAGALSDPRGLRLSTVHGQAGSLFCVWRAVHFGVHIFSVVTHRIVEEISMRATKVATPLIIIALSLVAACESGPQIRVDGDPSANLSSYKTFGFFSQVETDKSKYTTMISTRLKDATRRELQNRGYQEAENPQLLVNFNTNVENRTDVQSTPSASAGFYGYRAGAYGMWAGYPQDVQTTHYQEGTLAIDLVDAAKKQLVWQGVAQARITKSMRENPTEALDSIVADIFEKYPVPSTVAPAQ
jgi:Domain of unknown function (DUF4136)